MSERITEADLRQWDYSDGTADHGRKRLVAEVRRLRALIARFPHACYGSAPRVGDPPCFYCGVPVADHGPACPFPALDAEACAIREEGTPLPERVHIHRWIDCTRFDSVEAHEICAAPDGPPCPTPHRFISREKYLPGGTQPYPRDGEWRYELREEQGNG